MKYPDKWKGMGSEKKKNSWEKNCEKLFPLKKEDVFVYDSLEMVKSNLLKEMPNITKYLVLIAYNYAQVATAE